jgi:hypothetical protein
MFRYIYISEEYYGSEEVLSWVSLSSLETGPLRKADEDFWFLEGEQKGNLKKSDNCKNSTIINLLPVQNIILLTAVRKIVLLFESCTHTKKEMVEKGIFKI